MDKMYLNLQKMAVRRALISKAHSLETHYPEKAREMPLIDLPRAMAAQEQMTITGDQA